MHKGTIPASLECRPIAYMVVNTDVGVCTGLHNHVGKALYCQHIECGTCRLNNRDI